MFIEEDLEIELAELIKANVVGFKLIDRASTRDLSVENIGEIVKIAPACLVGIFDEEWVSDASAKGEAQILEEELLVYVIAHNVWKHSERRAEANELHRSVKYLLRGLVVTGKTAGVEDPEAKRVLLYRGKTYLLEHKGVIILEQRYAVRLLDSNE